LGKIVTPVEVVEISEVVGDSGGLLMKSFSHSPFIWGSHSFFLIVAALTSEVEDEPVQAEKTEIPLKISTSLILAMCSMTASGIQVSDPLLIRK